MANCEICGKPCGFMSGGKEPYTSRNLFLCNECGGKFKELNTNEKDTNKTDTLIKELLSVCSDDNIRSIIEEYTNKVIKRNEEFIISEKKAEEEIQRRKEVVAQMEAKHSEVLKNFKYTTGYDFEGYKIKEYKGIVSGEVVLGTGFLSEWSASISDTFGTQSNMFANKMVQAKQGAMKKLTENALIKGGNALIGVDFDYITFSNNILGVSANGTAVVIEKEEV